MKTQSNNKRRDGNACQEELVAAIGAGALALAAGLGLAADMARAQVKAEKVAVYSSVGPRLVHLWELDSASAALASRGTVTLPANVQYAVAHPNGRFLYVASSNGTDGDKHHVSAFRIGKDGVLEALGEPTALPHRPIHVTTDRAGAYLLLAFNKPRTVMVYKIDAKGGVGAVVIQPTAPDGGFFVHQVRVDRSNRVVLTAALGADAGASGPEQIGKLTTYTFKDGVLALKASVVPGPGLGPRHLDFHPTRPLVFVAIERGNKLHVHQLQGGALGEKPLFAKETLKDPAKVLPKQRVGRHPRASQRALRLSHQPQRRGAQCRRGHGGAARLRRRRKQSRGVRDRRQDRRADADPARRDAGVRAAELRHRPERAHPDRRRTRRRCRCSRAAP